MKKIFCYLVLTFYPIAAATIQGIVIDETDNTPLIGANVLLNNLDIGGTTDINGEFTFSGINKGQLNLEISMSIYEFQEIHDNTPRGTNRRETMTKQLILKSGCGENRPS